MRSKQASSSGVFQLCIGEPMAAEGLGLTMKLCLIYQKSWEGSFNEPLSSHIQPHCGHQCACIVWSNPAILVIVFAMTNLSPNAFFGENVQKYKF
jgi:hypothetical protein